MPPPRPLHHQLVLGREIVITERMDIHLVWTTGRMSLKPIPRFLLEPQFWTKCLSCGGDCSCSSNKDDAQGCIQERGRGIRQRALGFLFSYAGLISHESDFRIAKENRLLPPEISWPGWRIFVEQLDTELIYPHIDPQFHHGELRLNRLSKIYCLRQNLLRGYLPRWNQYSDFVHDKFILLASSDATRRYAHRDAGRARHRPRIYPYQQTNSNLRQGREKVRSRLSWLSLLNPDPNRQHEALGCRMTERVQLDLPSVITHQVVIPSPPKSTPNETRKWMADDNGLEDSGPQGC